MSNLYFIFMILDKQYFLYLYLSRIFLLCTLLSTKTLKQFPFYVLTYLAIKLIQLLKNEGEEKNRRKDDWRLSRKMDIMRKESERKRGNGERERDLDHSSVLLIRSATHHMTYDVCVRERGYDIQRVSNRKSDGWSWISADHLCILLTHKLIHTHACAYIHTCALDVIHFSALCAQWGRK